MRVLVLGAAAAIVSGAALSAAPASAGSYFEFGIGPSRHYYAPPPPPPPVYYAPRRAYYYEPAPVYRARPREVCRVRTVREWGPYGPYDKRVETCRRSGGW